MLIRRNFTILTKSSYVATVSQRANSVTVLLCFWYEMIQQSSALHTSDSPVCITDESGSAFFNA